MPAPTIDTLLQGFSVDSDQGDIAFCGVNLVEARRADGSLVRIVVDTGHFGRGRRLRAELAARGLTGSDVDVLVLTHAHWDHVQALQYFDRAVVVAHPREMDYITRPHPGDFATPAWTKAVLDGYDVRPVVEGTELAPGVVVVEAPGHSPGCIALAVSTAEGLAVVTGDAIQTARVARERRNALVFWSREQADASVTRLVEMADVVYPGHDRPFRLTGDGAVEYLAEFRFGLLEVTPGVPGLSFAAPGASAPQVFEPPAGWTAGPT